MEQIDADYRNSRGVNYLAVYPSLNGTTDYFGVASSTAMWHHYDPNGPTGQAVDRQLGWIRQAGFNTVRVFLSLPAWEEYETPTGNLAVDRFVDFLDKCRANGLWCSPVIWDNTLAAGSAPPTPGGVQFNMKKWHSNPGEGRLVQFMNDDPTLKTTIAGEYIVDFVEAAQGHEAFGFWQLMNEPSVSEDAQDYLHDFLEATLHLIDQTDPAQKTLLLSKWDDPNYPLYKLASDPRVDLIGIHPYGITRAWIESWVYDATHISDANNPGPYIQKPVVATEIGNPGTPLGSYADAANYATHVPRADLGMGETGIGYQAWVFGVGWEGGSYPSKESCGMVYDISGLAGDDPTKVEVREIDAVMAFVDAAIAQNVDPQTLFAPSDLVELPGDSVHHIDQTLMPIEYDGYAEMRGLMTLTRPEFTWDKYLFARFAMHEFSKQLRPFAAVGAGNPYATGGPKHVSVIEAQLLLAYAETTAFGTDCCWEQHMQNAISLCPGSGVFDPENNDCHLNYVWEFIYNDWRNLLLPYFDAAGGPY